MGVPPDSDSDSDSDTAIGKLDWRPFFERQNDENDKDWFQNNSWDYAMHKNVQVKDIYEFVKTNHLDKYRFKKVGNDYVGCRHWV